MNIGLSQKLGALRRDNINAEALRRVPSYRISPFETAAYALPPVLLVMAGAMPSAAIVLMPIILPFLYILFRRFGIYFPLACVCVYGAAALTLNYDILTVIYFVTLVFALFGLVLSAQMSPYLLCAAVAVVFAVVGAFVGMGIVRLAEGKPLGDVASDYVKAESEDPVIGYFIFESFAAADFPASADKPEPSDPNYESAAVEYFAEIARKELDLYAPYYCIHFGGLTGAIAYFVSVIVNRRTAGKNDVGATEAQIRLSSRALGGVRPESTAIADMRVPRLFLAACVAPSLIAGLVLELLGGYGALASTVMHAFVTLPASMSFFALMCFFASLFRGKAQAAANVVVAVCGAVLVVFPAAMFIASIIGVCDILLNLRFWTRFIMSG